MAIGDILNEVNSIQETLNSAVPLNNDQRNQFKSDGFLLPATYSADGNGLPSSKVTPFKDAQLKRNIVTWFVPQIGIVRMYVNPSQISYTHGKLISKDRTKGGFTLQYWGEDLDKIAISGTTGSSGIEGINVLYEVYRAEQLVFDGSALTIAANNASTALSGAFSDIGGEIGGTVGGLVGGAIGGLLGMDPSSNNLAAQNIPSLAQLAFTVEMYYNGVAYRGFFTDMTVTESADNFLMQYSLNFTVTQRRGYRHNYFPWSKSATNGPSSYTTPYSFSGKVNSGF